MATSSSRTGIRRVTSRSKFSSLTRDAAAVDDPPLVLNPAPDGWVSSQRERTIRPKRAARRP